MALSNEFSGDGSYPSPARYAVATERLILFTRFPVPGQTKTRLIPALGPSGAAALQRRLTLRTLRAAEDLKLRCSVNLQIQFDGVPETRITHWLGDRFDYRHQAEGDLGQRMASAFENSYHEGFQATVIIGADCAELTTAHLIESFARLRHEQVVLGPARDGGYYLIGLRRPIPDLFRGLSWGTDSVLSDSLRILQNVGLSASLLEPLNDLDRPQDLLSWRRISEAEEKVAPKVSVVIPALNECHRIQSTVASALRGSSTEVLVVDGGSGDETVTRARVAGATVLTSRAGRARQMNSGASRATGNLLLFLHADTLLPPDYPSLMADALRNDRIAAGAFRFAIAEEFSGRKFIEWSANLRSCRLQMPYGDQGLFMRRSLFEELGGFPDVPILEDYELVRRLRHRGRVLTLSEPAFTSGRRWQRLGLLRATLINQWVILGYRIGWPIERLARTYRQTGH